LARQEEWLKKIRYYLDTTMFNFAFAEDATEKRELTIKFFEQLPNGAHGLYISEEVIREISRAPEPRRFLLDWKTYCGGSARCSLR